MSLPGLTVLNQYRLLGTVDLFYQIIAPLVDRVRREGEPGVIGYRFFANSAQASASAVIDYATTESWIGHHEIAMDWPEMMRLHEIARLTDVTFLGPLTPQISDWLGNSSLTARVHQGSHFAAGFRR